MWNFVSHPNCKRETHIKGFREQDAEEIFGYKLHMHDGKITWRGASKFTLIPKYHYVTQMKEYAMHGTCSTHVKREKCVHNVFGVP
jgi:hypothetical protein